jgi:hypothetical protein
VALSRATARPNIRILAVPAAEKDVNKEKGKGKEKKKPTIYKEVLTLERGNASRINTYLFRIINSTLTLKINKQQICWILLTTT